MSNRKPLYLLAGGREGSTKSTKQILQAVFREIGKESPSIAYIGAASDDNRMFYQFIAGMIKRLADCKVNRVLTCSQKADMSKAKEILASAGCYFHEWRGCGNGDANISGKESGRFPSRPL